MTKVLGLGRGNRVFLVGRAMLVLYLSTSPLPCSFYI